MFLAQAIEQCLKIGYTYYNGIKQNCKHRHDFDTNYRFHVYFDDHLFDISIRY